MDGAKGIFWLLASDPEAASIFYIQSVHTDLSEMSENGALWVI